MRNIVYFIYVDISSSKKKKKKKEKKIEKYNDPGRML